MFWRKQRSRSPPRLTSTIPEMEQHLATMDTPVPEPPIDKVDACATTFGDLAATPTCAQDQTDMQADKSEQKGVQTAAEPQGTIPKDDANGSTTAHEKIGSPKSKTIRVKAQRSRPRLLTLIACVSYLLFHLTGVDIGLRVIQGYTQPRLQLAEVQLTNTVEALAIDHLLDVQLSNFLDTTLDRRYVESSYEHCLARGLHKANHVFRGFDFTSNPHIRNRTVSWVTFNCCRLLYTPQVHSLRASKLRRTANHLQQAVEKALRLFRHKAALLRCRLHGINPRLTAQPISTEPVNYTTNYPRVLPEMPYGFGLDCEEGSRCRLVFSGPPTPNKSRKTLKDAVAEARREVGKWSWKFEKTYRVVDYMITPLAFLQSLLCGFFLLTYRPSHTRHQPLSKPLSGAAKLVLVWQRFCADIGDSQHQLRLALGLIVNTALYALLQYQLRYIIAEFDRALLPAGLGLCIFHSVQALAFFDTEVAANETLRNVCRATKELYLIAQGVEDLPEGTPQQQRSAGAKKPTAKSISKIAARFISPLTPISEDIQQERKAMHAEQGKQPRNDVKPQYGYATDTDSDYDSDVQHASYVDLTGGATPTVSEDEEWNVVLD